MIKKSIQNSMLNISSNNKSVNEKSLAEFLLNHKVESGKEYTHTTFGQPWGSFYINDNELDEFYEIYKKTLLKNIIPHIVEYPKNIAPLCIDIDFKFSPLSSNKNRKYNKKHIECLIKYINSLIKKYIIINNDLIISYVFEKDSPTENLNKNGTIKNYKDGFHIIYPHLALTPKLRYFIINETENLVMQNKDFSDLAFDNPIEDVFDKCIINRNGWMMYGSKKDKGKLYLLTYVYNDCCQLQQIPPITLELIKLLSVRKFNDDNLLKLNPESTNNETFNTKMQIIDNNFSKKKDKIKNLLTKNKVLYKNDLYNDTNIDDNLESDIEINNIKSKSNLSKEEKENIEILVNLLNPSRAYYYEQWSQVGWCLKNIHSTLLPVFKKFSNIKLKEFIVKNNAGFKEYDEEGCNKLWESARTSGTQLTIASLYHWAKSDNPTEYLSFLRTQIKDELKAAENSDGAHYEIAIVLYKLYKHQFKCSSIKHNTWYEFQNHRWVYIENGYTLNLKISTELNTEFLKLMQFYYSQMSEGVKQDDNMKIADNIRKIIKKLKDTNFKKSVMAECTNLFYDHEFEEKLDSNRDIIGFNNGVYDLKQGIFRNGVPEDYLTFSTGYDYKSFNINHPDVKQVIDFFSKIQPEPDMRDYLLTLFASHLDGWNKQQKFILFTGYGGCHAKGTNVIMFDGTEKKVENVCVGDLIMGDDSTPRIVKQLYRGNDKMYKISPIDDEPYIVNGDHILSLIATNFINIYWKKLYNRWEIKWHSYDYNQNIIVSSKVFSINKYQTKNNAYKAAEEFMNKIIKLDSTIKNGNILDIKLKDYIRIKKLIGEKNYLGYRKEINFNHVDVDIDPYLFGCWLGSGISTLPRITIINDEIIEELTKIVKTYQLNFNKTIALTYDFDIITENPLLNTNNKFIIFLHQYNLINNKHIPNIYKYNDKNIRLKLLAGIIDSFGFYNITNDYYEIKFINEKLINDIIYIAKSLGFFCYKTKCDKIFNISIIGNNINIIPCILKRNQIKNRCINKYNQQFEFKIEELNYDDYYGFELDKNHRYLTSDFVVHHNSNGKSTAVDFLNRILGDYASTVAHTLLTRKRAGAGAATPELADKRGIRFIQINEPSKNDNIEVGFMKELTGNDKIPARALYGDPFYYRPQFKFILICNKLPLIDANDGGTWRRIRVIPWDVQFLDHDATIENPKLQFYKDYEIDDKLELWKAAGMWYLLKFYYPLYKNKNMKEPPKVTMYTEKYKKDSDLYHEFIVDNFILTRDKRDSESILDIANTFKNWIKDSYHGNNVNISKKELITYFESKNFKITETRIYGIRYKVVDDDKQDELMDNFDD